MPAFSVLTTSGFERDVKKIVKKNPKHLKIIKSLVEILKIDPYNQTHRYDIKKLVAVKSGEGEYRIRRGSYRLRYDIIKKDVLLYSLRDRKAAY